MKINFDVDIDVADRNLLLNVLPHTPASIKDNDGSYSKHNTGIYLQSIPKYPLEGFSALDYEQAEDDGWFKIDILNNHVYKDILDDTHLNNLMSVEPIWELLEHKEFVQMLFHIGNHHDIVVQYKPSNIEQLAMILALIRPGKRHLIGRTWDELQTVIWEKPADNSYYFKRSHAIGYATVIALQMNLICEKAHSRFA
jgi:hypothetical protein